MPPSSGAFVSVLHLGIRARGCVRLQVEGVIVEGAGAAPIAAALAGRAGSGKIVCVVSGGNLDAKYLIKILEGGVP